MTAGILLTPAAVAVAQTPSAHLTRPAIDVSIFRDGEVKRSESVQGQWKVICDEIARLNQRYCSLETIAKTITGEAAARIVVSTSDQGRPAAIAFLPLGIHLPTGMRITADGTQVNPRRRGATDTDLMIPVAQCDRRLCTAGWALSAQEVSALNSGAPIRLRYRLVRQIPPFVPSTNLAGLQTEIHATLSTQGFREAVSASMK